MTEQSQTIRPRHQTASLIMLILDVIWLLCLLYCTTIIAAKFRKVFEEMLAGERLPALTQLVMSIPPSAFVSFFIGAIAALIYKEFRITDRTRTLRMNWVVFAAAVLLFVVLIVAFFSPLMRVGVGLR